LRNATPAVRQADQRFALDTCALRARGVGLISLVAGR
jgi:hypothetical protein